jgi:hypothetical protein
MSSERKASSVTIPPAFRIMCASPVFNPSACSTVSCASMHVTIASLRAGGMGKSLSLKSCAYCRFARTTSSVTLIERASLGIGF